MSIQDSPIYVLSPSFVIAPHTKVSATSQKDTNVSKVEELFELVHQTKDKTFLINASIKAFLEAFQVPNDLTTVSHQFAEMVGCDVAQIAPTLSQFFKQMSSRKVLIPADKAAEVVSVIVKTSDFELGQQLGVYQLQKRLRNGEKEQVYIAHTMAATEPQKVVLKILNLPRHWQNEKKQWARHEFYQEFRFLEKLHHHPNIYKLLDFVDDPSTPYAVLSYIEGEAWKSFIRNKELSRNQRFKLLQQAFGALAHLHQNGILHGDIHASNFMVRTEDEEVLLIDFGFSNHAVRTKNEVTHAGGVFQYMPPERISTNSFDFVDGPATYTSEVFQLGIITYYALYETMPFKGRTWQTLSNSILNEMPLFLPHLPNGEVLSKEVTDLLKKMLHKQPEKRFDNAQSLLKAWEVAAAIQAETALEVV